MQVEVKQHDYQSKQQYKKWKRSVEGEASLVEDVGDDVEDMGDEGKSEEGAEVPEGEGITGEAVAPEGSVRKERSLVALTAANLAGEVVGGHIG